MYSPDVGINGEDGSDTIITRHVQPWPYIRSMHGPIQQYMHRIVSPNALQMANGRWFHHFSGAYDES